MRNSEEEATPLQLKLNVLADQIGKFGFLAAGLMFMWVITNKKALMLIW